MRVFVVGKPIAIYKTKFLSGKLQHVTFSKADYINNITSQNTVRIFNSEMEAFDYARSLRVSIPTKIFNPSHRQFAPVYEIELDESCLISRQMHEEITYAEFANTSENQSIGDRDVSIYYSTISGAALKDHFTLISATFPDTNRDIDYIKSHSRLKCG